MQPSYLYIPDFFVNPSRLFSDLKTQTQWDHRMRARKTASYGVTYNYSQMAYPDSPIPDLLMPLLQRVATRLGFEPNNILLPKKRDKSEGFWLKIWSEMAWKKQKRTHWVR